MIAVFCAALLLCLGTSQALAGLSSGARIMEYPVSSRALAMGEAFVGLADDVSAMHYNPAGLLQIANSKLSLTYYKSLEDTYFSQLAFSTPLTSDLAMGAGLAYLNGGKIDLVFTDGREEQRNAQQDFLFNLAGGFRVYGLNLFGVNLKVLRSTLAEEYTALAFALDAGILYALSDKLHFGFCLKNIGPGIQYDQEPDALPAAWIGGLAYGDSISPDQFLNVALEVKKPLDLEYEAHVGAEYIFMKLFSLRVGYQYGYDKKALCFGAGLGWEAIQLDYAFNSKNELGNNHLITLGMKF